MGSQVFDLSLWKEENPYTWMNIRLCLSGSYAICHGPAPSEQWVHHEGLGMIHRHQTLLYWVQLFFLTQLITMVVVVVTSISDFTRKP
jgi:hypothetical protein